VGGQIKACVKLAMVVGYCDKTLKLQGALLTHKTSAKEKSFALSVLQAHQDILD